MTETSQLGLPLVQAAQAQKHVTVNEALARLDGLVQLRLSAHAGTAPPVAAGDGEVYAVPAGASGAWVGQDDTLALFSNGLWEFVTPAPGWLAHDLASGLDLRWDGIAWQFAEASRAQSGAATVIKVVEADVAITAGADVTTADLIPSHAQVIGVTARVISEITGTGLTGWSLGVPGSTNRHGSGLGTALNSFAKGITGQPVTYYSATPLVLTAEGGTFTAGTVRVAIHMVELAVPDPV